MTAIDLYPGKRFELYNLSREGLVLSHEHIEIISLRHDGIVRYKVIPSGRSGLIEIERVSTLRSMGIWRTNSERWPV